MFLKLDTAGLFGRPFEMSISTCIKQTIINLFFEPAEIAIDIVLVIIPFVTFFFRFPLRLTFKRPSPTNNNDPIGVRVHLLPVTRRLLQICFLASLLTTAVVILTLTLLFKTHTETRGKTGYMALVLVHLNASSSFPLPQPPKTR